MTLTRMDTRYAKQIAYNGPTCKIDVSFKGKEVVYNGLAYDVGESPNDKAKLMMLVEDSHILLNKKKRWTSLRVCRIMIIPKVTTKLGLITPK